MSCVDFISFCSSEYPVSIESFVVFLSLENSEEMKAIPSANKMIFSKILEGEERSSGGEGIWAVSLGDSCEVSSGDTDFSCLL